MNGVTAVPAHRDIETVEAALEALEAALPAFLAEARSVLGGELHYQAMLYHALRTAGGVPVGQLGMNVKQLSRDPVSALFREKAASRHVDYAGVAEPIPDAVIFGPGVGGDWRRRRREVTLREMLVAVELKVSERRDSRLGAAEVLRDIEKLDAHREEVAALGGRMAPVVMVLDLAPDESERMAPRALQACVSRSRELDVRFLHVDAGRSVAVGIVAPASHDRSAPPSQLRTRRRFRLFGRSAG